MFQSLTTHQSVYQITGFDRLNFVSDIANAILQGEHCRIMGLSFEANGTLVNGRLTLQVSDERHLSLIDFQLRSVRGLVSVQQTN
ncbi:ACT domain-containing protein [Fibrivirga algicola]|uniref:ACT domain-containing protein n=1 Tax=Fibrivirga algicola TaxID=2950420 RepID=A0ABX0QL15_9BACT|nr:ACT domain-containing protein [Fibrivirga algicola]NID13166.1 hypothetical protein [Fibrivirga algicola]